MKTAGGKKDITEHELRVRTVGKFLKDKRSKAGLTQQQVADALSYDTAQFISNWERGVSLPPTNALPKLAGMFKVPAREFIDIMMSYQEELLRRSKREMQELFASHKR